MLQKLNRRWSQRPYFRWFLYFLCTVLVLGIGFLVSRRLVHRGCSMEIPRCVRRMFTNATMPLTLPAVADVDHWQLVDVNGDVFVYSAYHEKNFKDRVRIIGALSTRPMFSSDLYCILWHSDLASVASLVKASVVTINEGHYTRVTAAYFVCHLRGRDVPSHVSLADAPHVRGPFNFLNVHLQIDQSVPYTLTACVSPMFYNHNNPKKPLVEWFETNRILGVELFTVYVHNITGSDFEILKYYESKNVVEILNWTLSEKISGSNQLQSPPRDDIHSIGQLAALNDCLYRNKGRSAFTMTTDLDELIIPHHQNDFTLIDMMNRVPNKAAFVFKHSYFPEVKGPGNPVVEMYGIDVAMLDRIRRGREINPATDRSKIIFRPDAMVTVGIHNPWAMLEPAETHVVDPDIGMLHHYRSGAVVPEVTDKSTEKYLGKVLENMNRTIDALQN